MEEDEGLVEKCNNDVWHCQFVNARNVVNIEKMYSQGIRNSPVQCLYQD